MPEDTIPSYLTPKAAARHLAISASQLAKLRVYGGGPAYSKAGRLVRYTKLSLDAWMTDRTRLSTSDKGGAI
jgi:hypothetical protein